MYVRCMRIAYGGRRVPAVHSIHTLICVGVGDARAQFPKWGVPLAWDQAYPSEKGDSHWT